MYIIILIIYLDIIFRRRGLCFNLVSTRSSTGSRYVMREYAYTYIQALNDESPFDLLSHCTQLQYGETPGELRNRRRAVQSTSAT